MAGLDFLKREKVWLGGIACLGIGGMVLFDRTRPPAPAPIVWESKPDSSQVRKEEPKLPTPTTVTVDVDGAVKTPGVYTLPAGSRLKDALAAAGGPWSNADLSAYNRAAPLQDGTKVTIPKRSSGEEPFPEVRRPNLARRHRRPPGLSGSFASIPPATVEVPDAYKADETVYRAEPAPTSSPEPYSGGEPKKQKGEHHAGKKEVRAVNINSASAEALCSLPGVGPSTAEAIVAYRREHGPFGSVEALDGVKGIGPKKLEKMRPYVRL